MQQDTSNEFASLQDPNSIINALQTLGTTVGNEATDSTPIPSLNFTMPTGSDITSQYQTFLQQVSQDPSILGYYNQLLQYAQGDTNVAINQLKTAYQTTVQQTTQNLQNSLGQLGLTFTGESQNLLDTLNKRGLALVQGAAGAVKGALGYATGGEAGAEKGQLDQSQQLRQEAQQRSAQQTIQNAGLTEQKGITQANQGLQQSVIGLENQEQQDIYSRANTDYSNWQNQQTQNAQLAAYNQSQGGGGGSPLANASVAQRQAAWTAAGHTGDLPAGWYG